MDIVQKIKTYTESSLKRVLHLVPQKRHYTGATIVVLSILFLFYSYQLIDIYRNTRQIKALIPVALESLSTRNWDQAEETITIFGTEIHAIEKNINRLFPFTELPYIRSEVRAARHVLNAGTVGIGAGEDIINWLRVLPNTETFSQSYDSVDQALKIELLRTLASSEDFWKEIRMQGDLVVLFLKQAQTESSFPFVDTKVDAFIKDITLAQSAFNQLQPWLPLVPRVLGYPTDQTYLILLQNNTELRPTGGFIGTYGTVTLSDGSVRNFVTDNVYNLDEPAKAYNTKIPPLPLQTYIKQSQWFLRDVNWDPDFPTTAENAIQFYKDERGPIKDFDGVFALTPDFVEDLLALVGPVYVDENEFTAENLVDILAYHVELGFEEQGVTIYNRKQIIDDLAQQLQEKLFALSAQNIRQLAPVVFDAFAEKKLQLYFRDGSVQQFVDQNNWGGIVAKTKDDYVFVVDANLGSLKSDPAIERSIDYTVVYDKETDTAKASVSITYEHTGTFDWKTTRYRTYTRLYVPENAKLLSAKGNEEQIAIANEHGKTVFGTFISIEPGDTETLTFVYQLPNSIVTSMHEGRYGLYVQKQAGTHAHTFNINTQLPKKFDALDAPEGIEKKSSNRILGVIKLDTDKVIRTIKSK